MKEKIYKIEIEEKLQRVVKVKALNIQEAIEKVKDQYYNSEIVLDYEDHVETNFNEYNGFIFNEKHNSHEER